MSRVSISQAIKMAGISRSHFYNKYINTGKISVITENDKKLIDVSELIRVFGNIQLENNIEHAVDNSYNQEQQDNIVVLLEQQLAESKKRELEAKEREEWLKTQIDELRQMQHRLLEDKTQQKTKKRRRFLGIF